MHANPSRPYLAPHAFSAPYPTHTTFNGLHMLAAACAGAALALFAVFAYQLTHKPAPATFDLVGLRDGAAYTLDTGLTDDDCARYLALGGDMRFDTVRCERTS